jgi:hypothetical protein
VGPTVAGILFDAVGFPYGTMFIIAAELIALAALLCFIVPAFFRCAFAIQGVS